MITRKRENGRIQNTGARIQEEKRDKTVNQGTGITGGRLSGQQGTRLCGNELFEKTKPKETARIQNSEDRRQQNRFGGCESI